VNFKEEKSIFGYGQAQVRTEEAVVKLPSFIVAVYALLLLAAHRTAQFDSINNLPRAKWYPETKSKRKTTGDLLNIFRTQLYARAIDINFSHFVKLQYKYTNPKYSMIPLFSAAFYNRNWPNLRELLCSSLMFKQKIFYKHWTANAVLLTVERLNICNKTKRSNRTTVVVQCYSRIDLSLMTICGL